MTISGRHDMIIELYLKQPASVAQGIEQRFPVPCAGGSNPSRCVLRNRINGTFIRLFHNIELMMLDGRSGL